MAVDVSKALGYVVLKGLPGITVSKAPGYIVLKAVPGVTVSKAAGYVVLQEGVPVVDNEIRVSKALGYAVMVPGPYGPLSIVTAVNTDILYGGMATARVSSDAVEVLGHTTSVARVTSHSVEVLSRKSVSQSFVSGVQLEVLRSTAEVTVSALVSAVAVDYLYVPDTAAIRVSAVIVEVLRPADADGGAFGAVSVMG